MAILVLLILYAAAASAPSSPYGGGSGVIAFDTERGGNSEIYSITWDGSNETNITHSAAAEFNPDWSPDGSRLAFERTYGAYT
jgi:TolB protein